ncbi:anti-sigma factor domain-containing protein [Kocuria turfanensis]|uniref:anti-sigma factor n=1 Tax=Kocuria turfanensis TaxID=388357 RepID=UPI0040371693
MQVDDWSDDVHGDAALYAVDALEPEERAAFEEHLRGCAACRAEVDSFGEVGAALASAVAQDPPPALRADVLAAIHGTRSGAHAGTPAPTPSAAPPGSSADPGTAADVVSLAERRRPRRQRLAAAAAAAVLLPGAALGGWAIGTQTEQREQQQLAAQEQDRQARLLAAADVATHRLEVDGSTATLVVSEQEDAAMLVAADLPAPEEGREYQLWLMQDGSPVPDAHFGGGQVQVWLEGDVDRAGAVAMTVEPAGGSETPTLPVLAAVEV